MIWWVEPTAKIALAGEIFGWGHAYVCEPSLSEFASYRITPIAC